jgi:sialic acid synthase
VAPFGRTGADDTRRTLDLEASGHPVPRSANSSHFTTRRNSVTRELTIGETRIADDTGCFVIAEIGHNHQGDVEKAKRMIEVAHASGAHAAKLQKRDNHALFTKEYYNRPYNSENSFGPTYGEHRDALEFGRDEYLELKKHSENLGIVFFATAFDLPSADFLADLDMPAYKIASGDLTNTPLLRHVAGIGKPMVLSTGGGRMADVERAVETVMSINPQLALLQCTAGYPPEWDELNLGVITTFRERFPDVVVGLSSHDNGIAMAVAAYVLGARVIEKHFTLNRAWKGTDQAFSLEPQGLQKMVRDLQRTRTAMGNGVKSPYASEVEPLVKMSKKIVAARPLAAGHVLATEDLAFKSPGDGIPPYQVDSLIGMRLTSPLLEDDELRLDLLEQ